MLRDNSWPENILSRQGLNVWRLINHTSFNQKRLYIMKKYFRHKDNIEKLNK